MRRAIGRLSATARGGHRHGGDRPSWCGVRRGTGGRAAGVAAPTRSARSAGDRERTGDRFGACRAAAAGGAWHQHRRLRAGCDDGRRAIRLVVEVTVHFSAGGSADSVAGDVASWVHHEPVHAAAVPALARGDR